MMDKDNNDLISEAEAKGRIKESFANVDTDNNGYVPLKVLKIAHRRPHKRSRNVNLNIPEDDEETVSQTLPAFADFNSEALTVY